MILIPIEANGNGGAKLVKLWTITPEKFSISRAQIDDLLTIH